MSSKTQSCSFKGYLLFLVAVVVLSIVPSQRHDQCQRRWYDDPLCQLLKHLYVSFQTTVSLSLSHSLISNVAGPFPNTPFSPFLSKNSTTKSQNVDKNVAVGCENRALPLQTPKIFVFEIRVSVCDTRERERERERSKKKIKLRKKCCPLQEC